jgi:hypothetical protein
MSINGFTGSYLWTATCQEWMDMKPPRGLDNSFKKNREKCSFNSKIAALILSKK